MTPNAVTHRNSEPALLTTMRRAFASNDPLDLLALASQLMVAADPRHQTPARRASANSMPSPGLAELVDSFIGTDLVATSATLKALATLSKDEVLRARIRRCLQHRQHVLPPWLAMLDASRPTKAVQMDHVLDDGVNVMVGIALPDGRELTYVCYIDHNVGSVVKDGYPVAERIGDLVAYMKLSANDPNFSFNEISLADARARIEDALRTGAIRHSTFETNTWPASQPLLQWFARMLPSGGSGFVREEWSEEDLATLADRFFASPYGAALGGKDSRDALHTLLGFGTEHAQGDPLRWTPVVVEIVLTDFLPHRVVAPRVHLEHYPGVLREVIKFAHAERGIDAGLTRDTLLAVDKYEPRFRAALSRPDRGQSSLHSPVTRSFDGWVAVSDDDDMFQLVAMVVGDLLEAVGSPEALDTLTDEPLEDIDFPWEVVSPDIHAKVGEVLDWCDRCCDAMLDHEYRSACRRYLAIVATTDPNIFRRKAMSTSAAAAICWTVGKANELFDDGEVLVKDLVGFFGMASGGVTQRADTMLRALDLVRDEYDDVINLGLPELLVSSRRSRIIATRNAITSGTPLF